jgi:NAD(P)-dependent dehydrogenase (short-subunit alcohol dehydrogenase family)
MDLGLAGKTAVVTGASKGIGLAVVRGLAAGGVRVIAGARASSAGLDELARAGAIVSTCSVNAYLPDPAVMDYSAAKAALANFSKALSKEVGPKGIRVNTVSPGPVATDLWLGKGGVAATVGAASGADPGDVQRQAASQMVTGRFTTPEEVADLVLFLASDRAGNVTGADFTIDGGLVQTL